MAMDQTIISHEERIIIACAVSKWNIVECQELQTMATWHEEQQSICCNRVKRQLVACWVKKDWLKNHKQFAATQRALPCFLGQKRNWTWTFCSILVLNAKLHWRMKVFLCMFHFNNKCFYLFAESQKMIIVRTCSVISAGLWQSHEKQQAVFAWFWVSHELFISFLFLSWKTLQRTGSQCMREDDISEMNQNSHLASRCGVKPW